MLEQSLPPNPRAPSTNILLDESEKIFNLEEVKQRGLIRARYHTWNESRNGIIVAVNKTMIQVLFLTQIRTAAQYFRIPAIEVADYVTSGVMEDGILNACRHFSLL